MPAARLLEIAKYCDRILRTAEIKDYDGAHNGLQVENSGMITRIAAAVDASPATVKLAASAPPEGAGANLLIVHHGLFWSVRHPWTGSNYTLFRTLVESDLAVYSSHLPLDAHAELGNNARLCKALGLRNLQPFFLNPNPTRNLTLKPQLSTASSIQALGFRAQASLSRDEIERRLKLILGAAPLVIPGGPETCRRIGVVTGGAGAELKKAAEEGVDTFITGEGPHWTYALAEELGMNVFYGGHYATETFGVKALAAHLSRRFKVPWDFVDHPTGL